MTNQTPLIVDYQNPTHMPRKKSAFGTVISILVIMGIILLLISILLPSMCAPKERANRVKCSSNLRQIGQSLQLYNADFKTYPDKPERLITATDLSPEVFICPSTNDNASSPTNPTLKDHCSYIFLFQGKSANAPADVIIAYEDPKNHDGEGANFLFNDGHVDWFPKQEVQYILSELNAGHNPPRDKNKVTSTSTSTISQPRNTLSPADKTIDSALKP